MLKNCAETYSDAYITFTKYLDNYFLFKKDLYNFKNKSNFCQYHWKILKCK